MRRLETLAILIALLTPERALAEPHWIQVGGTENFIQYVDTSSINKTKNLVRYFVKWDYYKEVELKITKIVSLYESDCVTDKNRTVQLNVYTKDGNVVSGGATEWEYVMPETVTNTVHKFVCK